MVDVDLVPPKSFTFTVKIDLHYKYTLIHNFALILNTFICNSSIHQIHDYFETKICNLKYNVKNYKTKLQFIFMIFKTRYYSHIKLNMEINGEVLSLFTKNFSKITTKSMFYKSVIKQQIKM
jgi:hypothetical protein